MLNQLGQMVVAKLKALKPAAKKLAEPSQTAQPPLPVTTMVVSASASKFPQRVPKKLIILVSAVVIVMVAITVLLRLVSTRGGAIFPVATPSPSSTPTPIVEVPSQYADDEDVKRIEENMQKLDKELNEAQFRDDRLRIPTLDWEVEFD